MSNVGHWDLVICWSLVIGHSPLVGHWPLAIGHFFALAICSFAAVITPSSVNPNFLERSFSGALAPKVFMPTVLPVLPTYLCQPNVPAISTETRAVTCGGNTLLR